ncbi:exported hypothetical protein [Nostocoides japonicum T1-X7]|uniref:Uncharacterized protein n=1 Tax=Nostocoides japonicum T1-X7 TaxID=1194083 RepID=A0A077M4T3_9MICO|nr:PD40 domain-containing protein [Tetrasphaera japonica]CCH79109.1 exported hypothetical protein [Tetrasphaera japonica T1-X7]
MKQRLRVSVVAILLLIGTAIAAAPAQAAFPGRNGGIVVEAGGQIFTLNAQWKHRVNLGTGHSPRYSPDGRFIAYHEGGDIWVMNSDGSNAHRVTSGPGKDLNPAWSPDGLRIVFSRATTSASTRSLAVLTVATGRVKALTSADDGCAFDPTWASTGRYVVYADQCASGGASSWEAIRKVDVKSGEITTVIPSMGAAVGGVTYYSENRPDISPDGKRVIWFGRDADLEAGGIFTTNLTGRGSTMVSGGNVDAELYSGDPAVSPDGKVVAFGYGYDESQISSACIAPSGCGNQYYYRMPDPDQWTTSLDWQPRG